MFSKMHITLKSILKLISITIIVSNVTWASSNKQTLITQHDTSDRATIFTLEDYVSKYTHKSLLDKNISYNLNGNKVYVTLTVKQNKRQVLAFIKFTNTDKKDYFIHRRLLPFQPSENPEFFSPLCEDAFSIITEGFNLNFLPKATNICQYIEDDNDDVLYIDRYDNFNSQSDWIKIPAKTKINFRVRLNDAYYFFPGSHWYRIGTLRYRIVDDKWFIQRHMNRNLFSIFNFDYLSCLKSDEIFYVHNLYNLRERDYVIQERSMMNFTQKFFPYGGINHNYFDITSNFILVKINGDDVKSYFDTKSELLKN